MLRSTLKIGFYTLLLAALVTNVQAQNNPVKNVVLVHGAWTDGSGRRGDHAFKILSLVHHLRSRHEISLFR